MEVWCGSIIVDLGTAAPSAYPYVRAMGTKLQARVWRVVERCALALFSTRLSMWRERERELALSIPCAALTGSASLACALALAPLWRGGAQRQRPRRV